MFTQTYFTIPLWFWALLAAYVLVLPTLWALYRKWLRRQDRRLGLFLSDYTQWRLGAGLPHDKAKTLAATSAKMKIRTFKAKEVTSSKSAPSSVAGLQASMGWGTSKRKALFAKGMGAILKPLGGAGKFVDQLAAQSQSIKPLTSEQLWPQGNHLVAPLEIERYKTEQQVEILTEQFKGHFNTSEVSCAVQHRGRLLWESYADGMDAETPQMCKAISPFAFATVFGLLANQRRLNIDQEIPEEGWTKKSRHRLTFKDLLKSTSGLEPLSEKELNHALVATPNGFGGLIEKFNATATVGSTWKNSATDIVALSYLLSLGFGDRTDIYRSFVRKNLFDRLSMFNSSIALTQDGLIQAYSGMMSTPRDLLRLISLYQNDGFWLGERLLDSSWIDFVASPVTQSGPYGASVSCQTNVGAKDHKATRTKKKLYRHGPPYASLPQDAMFVLRDGQSMLVVIPSVKLSISFISVGKPLPDDGIESFVHTAMTMLQLDTVQFAAPEILPVAAPEEELPVEEPVVEEPLFEEPVAEEALPEPEPEPEPELEAEPEPEPELEAEPEPKPEMEAAPEAIEPETMVPETSEQQN